MVGSPNYGLFVYDGDGSGFGLVGPDGSDDIEALFEQYYAERNIPSRPTAFSGRSDYQAFINNGIPAGGLFTGAEGIKTAEEAALWGGTAGVAYDRCYHQACDTIDNVNLEAIDINADAIAYAVLNYAMNTEPINGVPARATSAARPTPTTRSWPPPDPSRSSGGAPSGRSAHHRTIAIYPVPATGSARERQDRRLRRWRRPRRSPDTSCARSKSRCGFAPLPAAFVARRRGVERFPPCAEPPSRNGRRSCGTLQRSSSTGRSRSSCRPTRTPPSQRPGCRQDHQSASRSLLAPRQLAFHRGAWTSYGG